MSNFFLLVPNYMLHGLGLLGRIKPARKARSPLGVSGNRGFYPLERPLEASAVTSAALGD